METAGPLDEVSCRRIGFTEGRALATRYRLNLSANSTGSQSATAVLNRRKKPVESVETEWAASPINVAELDCDEAPDSSTIDSEYILGLISTNKTASQEQLSISQNIYLRACKQLGTTPITLFFKNLPTNEIIIRNMPLTVLDVKACALAFTGNTKVATLDLTCDNICPISLVYLMTMIEDNHYISTLKIGQNDLGSGGARVLAKSLATNRTIYALDVSGNKFKEVDAIHLKSMIQKNTSLRELDLSHNELSEKGAEMLAAGLETNKTLESIDLSWNHIRQKGATAIALALQKNNTLERMNLAWNGLYVQGCMALSTALQVNSTLRELDISCNRIDAQCIGILCRCLVKNTTLEILKLCNNPLTTPGSILLVNSIYLNTESGISALDLGEQPVDKDFLTALDQLQASRSVSVQHGIVLRQDLVTEEEEDVLIHENPMAVLVVFMRMRNLRLIDLFSSLDKDGSKTLTKQEIKHGLLDLTIPLTEKSLDKLIDNLDLDNDGEIDFGELMAGHKTQRRKAAVAVANNDMKLINMKADQTERIMTRLKELMDKKMRQFMEKVNAKREKKSIINGTIVTQSSYDDDSHKMNSAAQRRKSIYLMQTLKITERTSPLETFADDEIQNGADVSSRRRQSVFGVQPWNDGNADMVKDIVATWKSRVNTTIQTAINDS